MTPATKNDAKRSRSSECQLNKAHKKMDEPSAIFTNRYTAKSLARTSALSAFPCGCSTAARSYGSPWPSVPHAMLVLQAPLVPHAMLVPQVPLVPQAMLVPHELLELQTSLAFQMLVPPFGRTVLPQTLLVDHCGNHLQLLVNGRTKNPCFETGS